MCQKVWAKGRAFFFLLLENLDTTRTRTTHKNRKKTKTTKAEGGKPEILLDSEPEKRLACRQFKHPPLIQNFSPLFLFLLLPLNFFLFYMSTPSITIKTLYSLCCFLRLIKHQVANEKGVRNHWKEKSLFPVSLEN